MSATRTLRRTVLAWWPIRFREWRGGKVRPIPGNSPHDRPVSRGIFSRSGEFATIPSTPLSHRGPQKHRPPGVRFRGMAESIGPMWLDHQNLRVGCRLPSVGPRASVKDATEGARLGSSSAMSSGRLFLDRVARQHCPSPLHRHTQINMTFSKTRAEGDISLLKIRSFMDARVRALDCAGYAAG